MGKNKAQTEVLWDKHPRLLEELVRKAIEKNDPGGPGPPNLHVGLAYTLLHQHRFQEAREVLTEVLSRSPSDPQALFCESKIAMFLREADAWKKLEARWAVGDTGPRPIPRDREWDGSPLNNRTVLVAGEGGLGDQIHFVRFAPHFKNAGAGRVIVSLDRRLSPLFRVAPGIDGIIELPGDNVVGQGAEYDVGVPMLTAPYLLGKSFEDVPPPTLLSVPEEAVQSARCFTDRHGSRLNVGLNWLSNKEVRRIPLQCFRELADVPGVTLFGLGERDQVAAEIVDFPIVNAGSHILQTAAMMLALDLVITVDSMAAHLGGSLGRPTWLLLHKLPDWRWGHIGEQTSLYPSLRLFRRTEDWSDLICKVADELRLAVDRFQSR